MAEGQPGRKPRVSDDDLLAVFRETDDPVLSTAEVTERVPIKRRSTLRRLGNLADDGLLASKSVGGRATVWWPTMDAGNRERDYMKSFGKYADTNIRETAETVSERFDRDLRERQDRDR